MTKRDFQAAEYAAEEPPQWQPSPFVLGGKVAAALGIESASHLTLRFEAGRLPIVEATVVPKKDAIGEAVNEIARHRWILYPAGPDEERFAEIAEKQRRDDLAAAWERLKNDPNRPPTVIIPGRMAYFRQPISVRIHAAAQRWCRYVWLKFLGR